MEEILLVGGLFWLAASAVGAAAPNTRIGKWCRKAAIDVRHFVEPEKVEVDVHVDAEPKPKG